MHISFDVKQEFLHEMGIDAKNSKITLQKKRSMRKFSLSCIASLLGTYSKLSHFITSTKLHHIYVRGIVTGTIIWSSIVLFIVKVQ